MTNVSPGFRQKSAPRRTRRSVRPPRDSGGYAASSVRGMVTARPDTGTVAGAARPPGPTHDYHEVSFMIITFLRPPMPGKMRGRDAPPPPLSRTLLGVGIMKGKPPQAVDFRFGMEITMYT